MKVELITKAIGEFFGWLKGERDPSKAIDRDFIRESKAKDKAIKMAYKAFTYHNKLKTELNAKQRSKYHRYLEIYKRKFFDLIAEN